MQAVFSIVTIVSVLIHGFLGCCWHHDHSVASGSLCAKSHSCCKHHHHHTASHNHGQDSKHGKGPVHKCEGESCVFARTESGHHADVLISPAVDSLSLAASAQLALVAEPTRVELFSPPLFRPSVRSHLLHQVMLI